MAIRKILREGTPSLRERSEELSNSQIRSPMMRRLVKDMMDSLEQAEGIGLAAPQIGEQVRAVLLDVPEVNRYTEAASRIPRTIYINPVITVLSEETEGYWEGCLSVPGMRGFVERPQHIQVDYQDLAAKKRSIEVKGFIATVFQHECDHLDGVLYIDKVAKPELLLTEHQFNQLEDEQNSSTT